MVIRNGHYRSPVKGYSRCDSKAEESRILDEELYTEGVPESFDDRGVAGLIFESDTPRRSIAAHDRIVDEPLIVDEPEARELDQARRSIRAGVTRYTTGLERPEPPRGEPAGFLTRLWARIRSWFSREPE